jgi:hypothetical protein
VARFGRGMVEFWHYLGGVGFIREGYEGIEVEGRAHKLLPPPNGGIQQPQNGV